MHAQRFMAGNNRKKSFLLKILNFIDSFCVAKLVIDMRMFRRMFLCVLFVQ